MLLIAFFLFGLIVGSFLNVVILRLEKSETLGGRSHCLHCGALIHWYDNIPVLSYLFLRGRCRDCTKPISLQYPIVELSTGILFAGVSLLTGLQAGMSLVSILTTLWYLVLVSILLVILVTDLRTMEIPLVLLVIGVVGAVLYTVLMAWLFHSGEGLQWGAWSVDKFLGGMVATGFFLALVVLSKETWMGMGDVWLAAILGMTVGIKSLLFTLTLSFFYGALVSLWLLRSGKKGLKSQIPFAPFLILGLFSSVIIDWINPWWFSLFVLPG